MDLHSLVMDNVPLAIDCELGYTMTSYTRRMKSIGSQKVTMLMKYNRDTDTLSMRPLYDRFEQTWKLERLDVPVNDNLHLRFSAQQLFCHPRGGINVAALDEWNKLSTKERLLWEDKSAEAIKEEERKRTTLLADFSADLVQNPIEDINISWNLLFGSREIVSCGELHVSVYITLSHSEVETAILRRKYIQQTCPTLSLPLILLIERCAAIVMPPGHDRPHVLRIN